MASPIETAPPEFQLVNAIDLVAFKDSKIIGVSVYSGRAEITRLFKFTSKTGQNQLNIIGLPKVMDQDSLRVEGRGAATIHDVTVSTITPPPIPTTSPLLVDLISKQKRTEKALARTVNSLASLQTYLSSVKTDHVQVSKLREVVEEYDSTAAPLDEKVTVLEKELKETQEAIKEEKKLLAGPTGDNSEKLSLKATIGVFADSEREFEISLIYAVNSATWSAGYDIRVDMQSKEKPVTLIYKGSITQSTGENWEDVPLTLETATPTFGLGVPTLTPWTLSVYHPSNIVVKNKSAGVTRGRGGGAATLFATAPGAPPGEPYFMDQMQHRGLHVSSRGNVSATFGVPGLINIPSDGVAHSVTIVKLELDATMSWVCVPKKDAKVHLKAKVKNASEYTLLAGSASVYVDGSFISKSMVPLVSPEESFDCPLGLDPSIRVTYHPRTKKVSQSGFYSKTTTYMFSQRITVHNTKSSGSTDAVKIKVIEQAPVSEDSTITVKLLQPPLVLPNAGGSGGASISAAAAAAGGELKAPPPLKVSQGVEAVWDGADEVGKADVDVEALGKEGRFCWICTVPSQSKIGLVSQWEVSAPARTDIVGF